VKRAQEWWGTAPSLLWLATFVLLPLGVILAVSFRPALPGGGIGEGWSLQAWISLLDSSYLVLAWRTLWISAVVTALCVAVALPVAYSIARMSGRGRSWMLLLVIVPFWTNFIIRVFAWQQMLHAEGAVAETLRAVGLLGAGDRLLGGIFAVLLVSVYTYLPFAILALFAAAEKFEFHLLDAARDLGAGAPRSFFGVFLPGIRRGMITAAVVIFIPMLGSYVVPDLVGGTETQMLGNRIAQRNFSDRNIPQAAALSAALTLLALAPMLLRGKAKTA
jgi:ABC-type spermidine/putrescine transport system permease subunit I